MREEKLLALGLGSRLLNTGASYQLFAPDNLISPTIARDNQGFSCCHHYHQMIHTIPNPVNLFLQNNKQTGVAEATTWITDSTVWKIT